jgi:hypothetical protein
MTSNEQKLIDEIMDWFSFSKVAKIMQMLEWFWCNCQDENGIPVESTLREAARKGLRRAIQESLGRKDYQIGSGGFNYRVWRENNVVTYVTLTFVVEEWSSEA